MGVKSFFMFFLGLLAITRLDAEVQPFIVVTPEKTGTHLLTKALERLVDLTTMNYWASYDLNEKQLLQLLQQAKSEGSFIQMHALPTHQIIKTLRKQGYKVIFLMRDPRDVVVSLYYAIEKGWAYGPYKLSNGYGKLTPAKKRLELISGTKFGLSVTHDIIGRRMPWMEMDSSFVCTVYFENLVGQSGGGSDQAQQKEIVQISNFLGLAMSDELLTKVTENFFGPAANRLGTFRKGQIGSWKEEFTPADKKAFKKVFGRELIELGYESDNSW